MAAESRKRSQRGEAATKPPRQENRRGAMNPRELILFASSCASLWPLKTSSQPVSKLGYSSTRFFPDCAGKKRLRSRLAANRFPSLRPTCWFFFIRSGAICTNPRAPRGSSGVARERRHSCRPELFASAKSLPAGAAQAGRQECRRSLGGGSAALGISWFDLSFLGLTLVCGPIAFCRLPALLIPLHVNLAD